MTNVNFLRPLAVFRAVLPRMRSNGPGTITTMSSDLAHFSLPMLGLYTATIAAQETAAETYALELGPLGLESLIVQPRAIDTRITQMAAPFSGSDRMAGYGPTLGLAQTATGGFIGIVAANYSKGSQKLVADAVLALLEKPYGQRPLRTIVDLSDLGARARYLNGTKQQEQDALLSSFNSDFYTTLRNTAQ